MIYSIITNLNKSKQEQHYRKYKTGKIAMVNPGQVRKLGWGEVKKPTLALPDTLIVDIDNTLSNAKWREHLVQGEKKEWDKFFTRGKYDKPNLGVIDFVKDNAKNHNIVIITGRPLPYVADTIEWLKNNNISFDGLYMRPTWDKRSDHVYKMWVHEKFLKGKTNVTGIIDDQLRIKQVFKKIGVATIDPSQHFNVDENGIVPMSKEQLPLFSHMEPQQITDNLSLENFRLSGDITLKTDLAKNMYLQNFNNELKKYVAIHNKYIGKTREERRYKLYITQAFNRLYKAYKEIDANGGPSALRMILRRYRIPLWYLPGEDIMSAIL